MLGRRTFWPHVNLWLRERLERPGRSAVSRAKQTVCSDRSQSAQAGWRCRKYHAELQPRSQTGERLSSTRPDRLRRSFSKSWIASSPVDSGTLRILYCLRSWDRASYSFIAALFLLSAPPQRCYFRRDPSPGLYSKSDSVWKWHLRSHH